MCSHGDTKTLQSECGHTQLHVHTDRHTTKVKYRVEDPNPRHRTEKNAEQRKEHSQK